MVFGLILKEPNEPSDILGLFGILTQDTIYKLYGWQISFLRPVFIQNKHSKQQGSVWSKVEYRYVSYPNFL